MRLAERQERRDVRLRKEADERLRKAERDAEERLIRVEQQKAREIEAIDRRQQKAEEAQAAEALRLAQLCQQQMLEEQEAIRMRNTLFLKDSEDRKHALARARESKRKRALVARRA